MPAVCALDSAVQSAQPQGPAPPSRDVLGHPHCPGKRRRPPGRPLGDFPVLESGKPSPCGPCSATDRLEGGGTRPMSPRLFQASFQQFSARDPGAALGVPDLVPTSSRL
ncbi:hypothetical protein VULLAG_LOCUS370 [Vulpes lagopus]